jgi:peroxiredoxin
MNINRNYILYLLLPVIAFSLYLLIATTLKPRVVPSGIMSLPAVNLLLADSQTIINTAVAVKNKPLVLFYFDPACSHCQDETRDILAKKEILKEVSFYFISLDSMSRIREFIDYYKLKDFPEITVAKDYEYKALTKFQIKAIPTNLVYNANHELIKIVVGDVKVNELKIILKS